MSNRIALAAVTILATGFIHLIIAPSALALCTPQQWQQNPGRCQEIFEAESQANAHTAQLICDLVSQNATPRGIWAVLSYLLSEQRGPMMTRLEIRDAIGNAIYLTCPEYMPVYREYRSRFP